MTKKAEQQDAASEVQVQQEPRGITREKAAMYVLGAIVGSDAMMNTVKKLATAENAKVAVMAAEMAVMFADALIERLAK